MDKNNILGNYRDWLEHHKMPAGKRKLWLLPLSFSLKKATAVLLPPKSLTKPVSVRQPFSNILKPKATCWQKSCSP